MARSIRLNYPDTFYHILSRGNDRKEIFRVKEDYQEFTQLLKRVVEKFGVEIHGYVLMDNHYHLIVRTREANLSRAIQWLGTSYSMWFNRRHSRSGHLFQGRFKSFVVEDEQYLAALCLYIHRNPIRAGIADRLSEYPWSSYGVYSGKKEMTPWLETSVVLATYGNNRNRFIAAQKTYGVEEKSLFDDLRCGLFLGSESFAESWQERLFKEKTQEKPQAKMALGCRDIRKVTREILSRLDEKDIESLLRPLRRARRPNRDLAIYILSRQGLYTHREIGAEFGVGYTSVTGALIRAEEYLQKEGGGKRKEVEKVVNGS